MISLMSLMETLQPTQSKKRLSCYKEEKIDCYTEFYLR